jgi:hypothetical protein
LAEFPARNPRLPQGNATWKPAALEAVSLIVKVPRGLMARSFTRFHLSRGANIASDVIAVVTGGGGAVGSATGFSLGIAESFGPGIPGNIGGGIGKSPGLI